MGGRMAQEENVFGCSYSGGGGGGGSGGGRGGGGGGSGGCRSKKIKPKKVPQRGLGVAQLEKIRLEEQQKKESLQAANILAKNAIASSSSDATSFLAVHKFRPNLPPFHNSVPLQPPPPSYSSSNLSSPNALYRHVQSVPNLEILQESCSVSKHSNASGGEIGSRAISSPRLWGGEYNLAVERQRMDHHGFAFDPLGNPPYESNTNTLVLTPPIVPQRSHHFQPPPSMVQVNSSSGISSSSVLSSHLEPPSNQSSRRNNYATQWTDEDKMVGMKRSYPFSLESPPPHSPHCSSRPSFAASSSRPDDLALCSSGYTAVEEPRNKSIRVSPLLERMPNEVIGDDEGLNEDFLSLAPPSSNLQHHHPSDYHLGCARSQMHQAESSGSVKQSFNFFPIRLPANPSANDVRNGDDEEGDAIDLNLKL